MPYKSKAQAAFMHINHPEIAKKWDKEYPSKHEGKSKLPEHVKKSTARLDIGALAKRAGMFDSIGRLAQPLVSTATPYAATGMQGLRKAVGSTLGAGKVTSALGSAGKAVGQYGKDIAEHASPGTTAGMGGSLGSFAPGIGKTTEELAAGQDAMSTLGKTTAGVGAGLGALGIHGMMKRKEEEEQQPKQANVDEAIGTPFTDGLLKYCLATRLDANQVVDLLEKGAAQEGRTGQECKAFLDRLLEAK